jgi:type IV secretion system protein VirD4
MVRYGQQRPATLYDLSCMLADESRTIKELFEEMIATPHADRLKELFPDAEGDYGQKAHIFIASAAREMSNKADNETYTFLLPTIAYFNIIFQSITRRFSPVCIHQNLIKSVPGAGRLAGIFLLSLLPG